MGGARRRKGEQGMGRSYPIVTRYNQSRVVEDDGRWWLECAGERIEELDESAFTVVVSVHAPTRERAYSPNEDLVGAERPLLRP